MTTGVLQRLGDDGDVTLCFELINAWQIEEIMKGSEKTGGYYSLNYIKSPGTC